MKSILEVQVSMFKSYYKPEQPKNVNLLEWLKSDHFAEKVKSIRAIENKAQRDKLKGYLPAITPGGIFKRRSANELIRFSGFLQLDIDKKDNPDISNFYDLKSFMRELPFVAYLGLSVSGMGFWGLVPISLSENYTFHFLAIFNDLKKHTGIVIDTKRKDIAGLRGYSYDPEAYFNHGASMYTKIQREAKANSIPHPINRKKSQTYSNIFDFAQQSIQNKGIAFIEGQRHEFLFKLCCILNSYGVPQHEAETHIYSNYLSKDQIQSNCISSPYKRYRHDFGKKIFE